MNVMRLIESKKITWHVEHVKHKKVKKLRMYDVSVECVKHDTCQACQTKYIENVSWNI